MALVKLEEVKHASGREYLIVDKNKKDLGHLFILDSDQRRKSVLLRLRLLRGAGDEELTELLTKIYAAFTKRGRIFKISILTQEGINTRPFTRLGFKLEGVLQENIYWDSEIQDEYIFGVTTVQFYSSKKVKMVEVQGERIDLRLAGPEDAPSYLEYYLKNKDFLAAFEPYKPDRFFTLEGQKQELTERFMQYFNGNTINFGIYLKDKLIGKIRISNIILGSFRSATVGYALSEDQLNEGYMSEALGLVCHYVFKDLELHRLEASTLVDNTPSQRVLENNGFKLLGLNPKYLQINGMWQDHYTYYLVKEDWEIFMRIPRRRVILR
jgi:ribosomal-protein-alanine N-acetyltransferase